MVGVFWTVVATGTEVLTSNKVVERILSRLAPALHFSSRSFSSSQGSLEKSGESTLNQEEVDKFRAMSRYDPTQQIEIQTTKPINQPSPKSLPAPGGILRECADLFTR